VVAALAVSQTVGYGALFYAFSVLLRPMSRDLHLSTAAVTGALTASTLASAVSAVPVGRWLDRRGGRVLMTAGSVVATVLLAAAATVEGALGLYGVWIGIGLVSGAVLYEAAFPVVVSWFPEPPERGRALLVVTVVAGFASSIFFPLTGHLVEAFGWRDALLVLAAVHGAGTIPLHLLLRRPPAPRPADPQPVGGVEAGAVEAGAVEAGGVEAGGVEVTDVLRDRGFWVLALAFVASGAAVAVAGVHLVAYLIELGHGPAAAAWVAGGLGVLSVSGRLLTTAAQGRWPLPDVVGIVFAVQAAGLCGLVLLGSTTVGAIVCVVLIGLGFGVGTIARPALLTERFGTAGFATLTGVMAVPLTVVKAGAPQAAAWAHDAAGTYTPVAFGAAACSLFAALVLARSKARG
jgi:sugar phosphate permease